MRYTFLTVFDGGYNTLEPICGSSNPNAMPLLAGKLRQTDRPVRHDAINSLARSVGSDARNLFNEHANVTRDDKDEESNG